jgi:serine protease Do
MSVRSLNWLKFTGLVGLAFALGLVFANLLNLPKASLAQGVANAANRAAAIPAVSAPQIPDARSLSDLSDAFAAVAEVVRPSVVLIRAQRTERRQGTITRVLPPGFEPFLPPGTQLPRPPEVERGTGSGFIVSADGYILTNHHVIENADQVRVQLLNGRIFDAQVVGSDANTDLAVLKIDASGLTPAALGSSDRARIGEWVLAIGNPLGENLTFTVTSGIISAKGRGLPGLSNRGPNSIQDFIQTDAAINRGNSGGPLVNVRGEVIGVNSAIASESGFNMGYGFAIPIDLARNVMNQLITTGRVERAVLGITVTDATELDAEHVGLDEVRGVKVEGFAQRNSPAERAGMRMGDIIVSIDGNPVEYVAQLQQIVGFRRPGETVRVEVARRGGARRTYEVRLSSAEEVTAAPAESPPGTGGAPGTGGTRPPAPEPATVGSLGITVIPLTPDIAREMQAPSEVAGVVIREVSPSGPAADLLVRNMVIMAVEETPVRTAAELQAALQRIGAGRIASLYVFLPTQDGGMRRIIRVRVGTP